ncbi:hypothetical protein MUTS16_20420 [Escherichia coli]|nr:hypothetical protein MUTS16_20420 [Escherichia coli]
MNAVKPKVLPFVLQQTGKNLRDAAVENAHGKNNTVQSKITHVVQVKQNGGHAEAHQAQRCRISQLSVAHNSSKIIIE